MAKHPELGFYTLAGAVESPRDLIDEVRQAETMGLGACFISERFNVKEAVTLSGAAAAVSDDIRIITAATNHNTRHPIVTASSATTMHFDDSGRARRSSAMRARRVRGPCSGSTRRSTRTSRSGWWRSARTRSNWEAAPSTM